MRAYKYQMLNMRHSAIGPSPGEVQEVRDATIHTSKISPLFNMNKTSQGTL